MIKNIKTFLAIIAALSLSSCIMSSNGVRSSAFYTSWKDRDFISRVDNSVEPNKVGKACIKNIAGLFSQGDSSIETAKKNGGITKVAFVDRSYERILLNEEGCTIVHGK
jgi:hypothetical protein